MKNIIYLPGRQALLLLLAILSIAAACNKDDEGSNPQQHEDILRCKVNGVEWEAFDYREGTIGAQGTGATDLLYYVEEGFMSLRAIRKLEDQSIDEGIGIAAQAILIGNNSIFNKEDIYKNLSNLSGCVGYNLDTLETEQIIVIEIDTINRIMVGEFEFSAINDCSDTVHITDGYFDLEYRF